MTPKLVRRLVAVQQLCVTSAMSWIFFASLGPSYTEPFESGVLKMISTCGGCTTSEVVYTVACRAIRDGAVGRQRHGFITEKVLDTCAEIGVPKVGRSV